VSDFNNKNIIIVVASQETGAQLDKAKNAVKTFMSHSIIM
jgi:hypothetical protein